MTALAPFRALNLALAGVSFLLFLGLGLLSPTAAGDGLALPGGARLPELCLTKRLTGEPCPSCGLGRSLVLAVHGQLRASRAQHPGGLLLLGWGGLHGLVRLALGLRARGRFTWLDLAATAGSFLAVAATVAFLR